MSKAGVRVRRALARLAVVVLVGGATLGGSVAAVAASGPEGSPSANSWFERVDAAQADQPHWISLLMTTTGRLVENLRYDQSWQSRPRDTDVTAFGGGKGLELIPLEPIEVSLGVPGYQVVQSPTKATARGWTDEALLVKYRLASANEESGNYVVSAFLGATVPTGVTALSSNATIWTPTLAVGKGWGTRTRGFDIQSTFAESFPTRHEATLGEPIVWNTALQAHVLDERFWPEVEVSVTHYRGGSNDGKDQVIMIFGVETGRFPLRGRFSLAFGAGYERAVSSFRTFNNAWVFSLRTPF